MRMYEAAVVKAMPSPTLSWSLRNHLFMLSLCHLAVGDNVATNRALEQYRGIDSGFANGQEYSLAANLLEAVSAGDKEMFEQIEASYLRTARQDPVRDKLLLLIKNAIQAQPDDDFS
jgi:alpha-soluble NSF attachment protein